MATGAPSDPSAGGIEARGEMSVADYWHERVALHHEDSYAGVPMLKFPEDLRVYEHLIWEAKPETIIEVGCLEGGSALWFRDRMEAASRYGGPPARVICVDIDVSAAARNLEAADPGYRDSITLVEGSILDEETVRQVIEAVAGADCMVVEDSAHTYETTSAALSAFSRLVPEGGFFVVEDGYVDIDWMRPSEAWPRGVQRAIQEWLDGPGAAFSRRRDLEAYILTCHPGGILQKSPVASGGLPGAGDPVANPGEMSGYQNAVQRLEERVAEAEALAEASDDARRVAEVTRDQQAIDLRQAYEHLERANAAIEDLTSSASWKITAPLRGLKRFLR